MQKGRPRPVNCPCGVGGWCGLWDWPTGTEAERFVVGPAVVLSEHLAEAAWPARNGAADLTGRDRKTGHGHREAAERGLLIAFMVPPCRGRPCAVPHALLAAKRCA